MSTDRFPQVVVALGGVRGVGKSTLVEAFIRARPSFEPISFSDRLWAKAKPVDGGDFAGLPFARRHQLRSEVDLEVLMYLRSAGRPVLLDMHYTDYNEHERRLIHSDILFGAVDWLILLDAPAHVIRSRRRSDVSACRSLDTAAIERERQSEHWGFDQAARRCAGRIGYLMADSSPEELVGQLGRMCGGA
jgi:adenylate kinase